MYQNKNRSKENSSFITNEVDTKLTDIFEQIQKKSEEFPSSEASIKIFKSLSNPTNLTNPQIIMDSKHFEQKLASRRNKNMQILKKVRLKNRLIFSTGNSTKNFPKSRSNISIINKSSSLIKNDISQIINNISKITDINSMKNTSRNKIILKRINKRVLNSDKKKEDIDKSSKFEENKNFRINKKKIFFPVNISGSIHSLDYGHKDKVLWEKLKNSQVINPQNKNKKIEEIKYFNKYNFKNEIYDIKLLQYHRKNQIERYEEILNNKEEKSKSLNEAIKKIEQIKKDIDDKYTKEYISYIFFLKNYIEKERTLINDLIQEKNEKLMEIREVQNQINTIKKNKRNLIKWLFLQIQVKEKLTKMPGYYRYIIEDNIPLFEINKNRKNKITKIEYNRILDYKGKNIYEDAKTFFKEYEILEMKAYENLISNNDDIIDMKLRIKNESGKDNKIMSEENIKINKFEKDLKIIKNKNNELIKMLEQIKINKITSIPKNNNKYLSNLSDKIIFYLKYDKNNMISSNNIYYRKGKPLIYNLVLFLYKWVSQNKFKEIENYSLKLNSYLSDEKYILKILEYAEIVINLLLHQKQLYYSNIKLKEKYIKIEEIIDKEIKREKFFIQLKIQEKNEIEKREKAKEKINKKYFKYNRKIDYDYFRKEINKKNKIELSKIEKREIKFEDFFYDNY